jgi:hypothetical protein
VPLLLLPLPPPPLPLMESLWAEFKAKHARDYASAEEEAHRFGIFTQNMEVLAEMQAQYPSEAPSEPSRYSDLTDEEVQALSAHLSEAIGVPSTLAPSEAAKWASLMPSGFDAEASEALVIRKLLSPEQIAECFVAAADRAPMPGASPLTRLRDVGLGARQPIAGPELQHVAHDLVYSVQHVVCYLHRQGHIQATHPALWQHLVHAMRTQPGDWGSPSTPLSVRCCELHTYAPGGSLLDPTHTDDGSELTLSVLLVAPEAGGELATWSAEGALVTHPLAVGDALLFHSAKRHNVTQVGGGCRTSLVVELWAAPPNTIDRYG